MIIKNPITVVQGGSPVPPGPQPLDPEQVYRDTRPADWLVMPTPQNNEIYLLYMIDKDTVDDQSLGAQIGTSSSSTITVEFGDTDSDGNFTANPALTTSTTGTLVSLTPKIPASAFGHLTSDNKIQLICKISATDNLNKVNFTASNLYSTNKHTIEIVGKGTSTIDLICSNTNALRSLTALRYVYLDWDTTNSTIFQGCSSLSCVRKLGVSTRTNASNLFNTCYSLTAIPQLNFAACTNFTSAFSNCASIVTLPDIGTSQGTDFTAMFASCYSLTKAPSINLSNATTIGQMFSSCFSLTEVPLFDTSKVINFNSVFYNCYALEKIPLWDTGKGEGFYQMFYGCCSLEEVPAFDTSSGITFSSMFQGCYGLKKVPLFNTSKGTNFSSMFSTCYSLTEVPLLDTNKGTSFSQMFNNCYSLQKVPALDTSSGTTFTSMFSSCVGLTYADLTGYDFTSVTGSTAMNSFMMNMPGNTTIDFGDSWGSSGILNTAKMVDRASNFDGMVKVRINKTDAMLPISTNASTLFTTTRVYVPDALLATYQADAYWNTLGTNLKAMSEWSA